METTVTLRPPFEYSWWVIAIGILLAALALFLLMRALYKIFYKKKEPKKEEPKPEGYKRPMPQHLFIIKKKYIAGISKLKTQYEKDNLSKRDAYLKLSLMIRGYVHEATGIDVEKCTLTDVKKMGIRHLDKLMEEYYVPEFAEGNRSENRDFVTSCNTAVGVIREWS
ncbi:hypothetical protein D6853_00870 [Butyrivibrio sp. X503]|uniref:hypothetical protein n=1 Tax=Butyrivibrio sp. X503 TaxID=2364878 RepID=UPI000EA874EF|nr:hypothetical protein [Butyrivibrio sp. X503]RKM58120.1 hypothetical protein D6853_00870 [Butyrivibrio sp. X503]